MDLIVGEFVYTKIDHETTLEIRTIYQLPYFKDCEKEGCHENDSVKTKHHISFPRCKCDVCSWDYAR